MRTFFASLFSAARSRPLVVSSAVFARISQSKNIDNIRYLVWIALVPIRCAKQARKNAFWKKTGAQQQLDRHGHHENMQLFDHRYSCRLPRQTDDLSSRRHQKAGFGISAAFTTSITERRRDSNSTALNGKLVSCRHPEDLMTICLESGHDFDAVNLTIALHRLAKMGRVMKLSTRLHSVCHVVNCRAISVQETFKPRDIATLMWANATLQIEPGAELAR